MPKDNWHTFPDGSRLLVGSSMTRPSCRDGHDHSRQAKLSLRNFTSGPNWVDWGYEWRKDCAKCGRVIWRSARVNKKGEKMPELVVSLLKMEA